MVGDASITERTDAGDSGAKGDSHRGKDSGFHRELHQIYSGMSIPRDNGNGIGHPLDSHSDGFTMKPAPYFSGLRGDGDDEKGKVATSHRTAVADRADSSGQSGNANDRTGKTVEKTVINPGSDKLTDGNTATISVRYGDANSVKQPFTFKVDPNGRVLDSEGHEVTPTLDVSNGVPSKVVILVDRPANFDRLSPAQQEEITNRQTTALNQFVEKSLDPALRQASPDVAQGGMYVQDRTGMLAQPTLDAMTSPEKPTPPAPMPEPVVPPSSSMSPQETAAARRIHGPGGMPDSGGSMPASAADGFFPKGTEALAGENPQVAGLRRMLSAAWNPDANDPASTVRKLEDGTFRVGQYGQSFNHLNYALHSVLSKVHWPQSVLEKLGDPPDWSKLPDILAENPDLLADADISKQIQDGVNEQVQNGSMSSSMASNFKDSASLGQFAGFVGKLKGGGDAPTKEEVNRFLPADAQNAMAQNSIKRGMAVGATPGQMALAQHLGKEPDQLTAQEKADPQYREFMTAADKYYQLANASPQAQPGDQITWAPSDNSGDPNAAQMRVRIANAVGSHYTGGYGWCARSVQQDCAAAGVPGILGSGNAWAMGQNLLRQGRWARVDPKDLQPGDLIFLHDAHGGYGDVRAVKARQGDQVLQYNDNKYTNNVNDFYRPVRKNSHGGLYDFEIAMRYVGDTSKFDLAQNRRRSGNGPVVG